MESVCTGTSVLEAQILIYTICYVDVSDTDSYEVCVSYCHHFALVTWCAFVSFLHFNPFLWNNRAKLNKAWKKCYLGGPRHLIWFSYHSKFHDGCYAIYAFWLAEIAKNLLFRKMSIIRPRWPLPTKPYVKLKIKRFQKLEFRLNPYCTWTVTGWSGFLIIFSFFFVWNRNTNWLANTTEHYLIMRLNMNW